jgi:pyruvate, water dikinase
MSNILWLKDIHKQDTASVGGKGANLGEMFNAGFQVPNAFVISALAFKEFLQNTNLKNKILEEIKNIDFQNTKDIEARAKKIQKEIISQEVPQDLQEEILKSYKELSDENTPGLRLKESCFVAVRSSATAEDVADTSFAGQQESFLNIKGQDALIEAVKKCWASLYTGRSITYRNNNKIIEENMFIAVIIQKMMNSEKSGVIFTVNPLTNNDNELVIEAVFGLGEGIVSGAIEPDHFVVNKKTEEIIEKRIGHKKMAFTRDSSGKTVKKALHDAFIEKEVLYTHELKELIRVSLKIEKHYRFPQDIEFAFEQGNLYIVQSRPITTLKKVLVEQESKIQAKILVRGLAASHGFASGKAKIIHSIDDLDKIQQGDILVTKMTNPDMVVAMQKCSAIVTDEGGMTAHAAIVSRELGIPCVVGTQNATKFLKENHIFTVDGTNGIVYEGAIDRRLKTEEKEPEKEITKDEIVEPEIIKTFKKIEHAVENFLEKKNKPLIKVNCDLPEVAEKAASTGADGVGLVRIEFMIAEAGIHPAGYLHDNKLNSYTEMLAYGIEKIAQAFKDKPVWVRTSDIRTDEYKNLKGANHEPKEDNPMIGWHGIRRSLDQTDILEAEFKAIKILHDKGFKNVGIMLPFLIRVDELQTAKSLMRKQGLEPCKDIEFGVMIETPASCLIMDELCKEGISFISFGTNDLTQLVLGIDRNNEKLASLYNEMHPAVLSLLKKVIKTCKYYRVKASICGQAASEPKMAKYLAEQGIDSLSVNIDSVDKIREILK